MKIYNITQNFMKFHKLLWNFTKNFEISPNFMKFHKILWNFTKFYEISQNFMKFHKISKNFMIVDYNFIHFHSIPQFCAFMFGNFKFFFSILASFNFLQFQSHIMKAMAKDKKVNIAITYLHDYIFSSEIEKDKCSKS